MPPDGNQGQMKRTVTGPLQRLVGRPRGSGWRIATEAEWTALGYGTNARFAPGSSQIDAAPPSKVSRAAATSTA
jgi:hypothetical protein